MKLFRRSPAPGTSEVPAAPQSGQATWASGALDAAGVWLRVDNALRVLEASALAREFFGNPSIPASLVNVTRSATLEHQVRSAIAGETGPWELEASHFHRVLRVRAYNAGAGGVVIFFEDITELRRLEAMRADFVANLAHELRTPIASLSLAVETLGTDLPPAEQRRFIERVAEETRYIAGVLQNLTELALLEGEVSLDVDNFNLREVIDESWRRVTDRQGPGLLANSVRADMSLRADRLRVAQIMQNLLENAQRFSPPGEAVEVDASSDAGMIEVQVRDHGPGIPPADLARVFERFYKVDRARTRRGDGSGLGLALSKHLVSAHGGSISASAAHGGGTLITFRLPH